ncbi:MAG: MFS transporter [Hyphomicrobiales bacterium]
MIFRRFLHQNARWLGAGALLTLSSSFGQTFFISLFAGEIRAEFGLSHGAWGGIYTLGTLASAAVMLWAGGLTDRYRVRHLAVWVLFAFSIVSLAMAAVPWVWLLPLVIFGLRFCGQGMLSHITIVALGRWFARNRGRANAVISSGYLLGEALLPVAVVLLMGLIGWRLSWAVAAGVTLLFVPALLVLLRSERKPGSTIAEDDNAGMHGRHWTRKEAMSHWLFWVLAVGLLAPPVFGTAFFFQQVYMTEIKGWELKNFVALMPLYTASGFISMFASGWIVDRWGSARLLPVAMLPSAVGFVLIALGDSLLFAAAGLVSLGLMQGAMVAIAGSLWPEYYGTRHLGSVRAVATSLMVFGSALGPGITGVLIDFGVDYRLQLIGMAAYYVAVSIMLAFAFARARLLLPSSEGIA